MGEKLGVGVSEARFDKEKNSRGRDTEGFNCISNVFDYI